jgi:hypothetical protein
MTTLTQLFIAAAALIGVLTSITVWAPRRLAVKLAAFGVAWLFLPVAYAGLLDLLSKPKPVVLEWWLKEAQAATVLGSSIHEGEGIFLWLQLDGVSEPRAYVLPWSLELAEQLQAAGREAERTQGSLRVRLPFESSYDDREPKFYALPQPAPPPKDLPGPPPELYKAPPSEA